MALVLDDNEKVVITKEILASITQTVFSYKFNEVNFNDSIVLSLTLRQSDYVRPKGLVFVDSVCSSMDEVFYKFNYQFNSNKQTKRNKIYALHYIKNSSNYEFNLETSMQFKRLNKNKKGGKLC